MKRFFAASDADPLCRGGGLDALRFLAAAFIVLYHYESQAPVLFESLHPALTRGYLGTDFFLMLSGYVLGRTYGPRLAQGRISPLAFLLRRYARVWPAHAVVLAGFAAVVLVASALGVALNNPEAFQWGALPWHALLMQSWGLNVPYGWNTPSWSLSALVLCYAAFPLMWPLLARLPGTVAVLLGALALLSVELAALQQGLHFFDLEGQYGVLRALPLFFFGAALARYGAPQGLTLAGARIAVLGAAALFFALQLVGRFDLASMLLLGVVILCAGAKASPKRSQLVARAAQLSFALYITHSLAGTLWFRGLGFVLPGGVADSGGLMGWGLWVLAFPIALVFAAVFDRLVDTPIQDWLKPRLDGRPRAAGRIEPAVV
jgi:peptidoglycan/LPS O-acetylase OafA/YrhL